ncbi:hypothetical protein M8C21_018534, partial [Ambrosia artemisiifolia]
TVHCTIIVIIVLGQGICAFFGNTCCLLFSSLSTCLNRQRREIETSSLEDGGITTPFVVANNLGHHHLRRHCQQICAWILAKVGSLATDFTLFLVFIS